MKFPQPGPTLGYRKNMILHALLKIEALQELASAAAPELRDKITCDFLDPEKLCGMVTGTALFYLKREPIVPLLIVELVEDEVIRYPFTQDEIASVMNSKFSDALFTQD